MLTDPCVQRSTLLLFSITACAGPVSESPSGPRGYRADQHLRMAARSDQRASELTQWPETRPGADGAYPLPSPWYGTWDTAAEHRRLAAVHRSAAAQLEAEYQEACADVPEGEIPVSPLQRYGVGGNAVPEGTLVILRPEAGPPDRLLKAMRCHRAWMMMQQRTDMADCPLDLPGIRVSARGDDRAIEVTIAVSDPALVPELRRRAAHDLEHRSSSSKSPQPPRK